MQAEGSQGTLHRGHPGGTACAQAGWGCPSVCGFDGSARSWVHASGCGLETTLGMSDVVVGLGPKVYRGGRPVSVPNPACIQAIKV